jgi:hypothetical protein
MPCANTLVFAVSDEEKSFVTLIEGINFIKTFSSSLAVFVPGKFF